MRFATVVELEETATGVPVRRAEVAWQMTALEARALGALGWGGSLVLRPESTLLRALVNPRARACMHPPRGHSTIR